jgi:hypothetical protein
MPLSGPGICGDDGVSDFVGGASDFVVFIVESLNGGGKLVVLPPALPVALLLYTVSFNSSATLLVGIYSE